MTETETEEKVRLSQGQGRHTERTITAVDSNCHPCKYEQRKSRKDWQGSEKLGEPEAEITINKKAGRFLLLSLSSDKKGTVKEDGVTFMCVCLFIFKQTSIEETLHNQVLVWAATNNHNFIMSLGVFHTQLLTERKLGPVSVFDLLLA